MQVNKLMEELAEVTGTLIAPRQLEFLSEKQTNYLSMLCENILRPNTWAFYYKPKDESLKIIKDILKTKVYLDKKDSYLKMKFDK